MTILIEIAIVTIFLVLAVTQIGMPLVGYGRYFWMFRKPERKLSKIEAEIEEIKIEDAVAQEEKRMEQLKQTLKMKGEQKDGAGTANKKDNMGNDTGDTVNRGSGI